VWDGEDHAAPQLSVIVRNKNDMEYQAVEKLILKLKEIEGRWDYWIDHQGFIEENSNLAPGAIISKYGYFVIGTTVGGNAITVSEHDSKIRFCDHTGWYDDPMTFAAKQDYDERPYSLDNVRDAQIVLAENSDELIRLVQENKLDRLIDEYD
jgi:hypothetical protein